MTFGKETEPLGLPVMNFGNEDEAEAKPTPKPRPFTNGVETEPLGLPSMGFDKTTARKGYSRRK